MHNEQIKHLIKIADEETDIFSYENESKYAKVFASVFYCEARYVPERKAWFVYDGIRWQHDLGGLKVMEKSKQIAYCLVQYAMDKYGEDYDYIKRAVRWHKRRFRETLIRDAASVNPMSIAEFDDNPYLLNFKNGTLDLQSGVFREHFYDDYITKCTNTEYDEKYRSKRFERFIDEVCGGDRDKAAYLQKALGYALCGANTQECLFILYGATTRNGKSTLMESVLGVMGEYACASNPETVALRQTNSNSPSEDIARLRGVRLVNISEPPQNLVLNAARVKTMTGSDTINARFLHENSFDFKPQFKMYINTNHLPVVNDTTLFASNRLHIIPFERHFAPEEQDRHLKEYFAGQDVKNAIGMWLVEGYFMYLAEGLTPPDSVKKATSDYEAASDKIKQFIDERLVREAGAATPTAEVYREYRNWCIGGGMQPLAQNKFSERLKRYGEVKDKRKNGVVTKCLLSFKTM
ncbi:MAG: DNA primase [Eubacterium sp.]|nr:DNA primase [Eubacterium sp.]